MINEVMMPLLGDFELVKRVCPLSLEVWKESQRIARVEIKERILEGGLIRRTLADLSPGLTPIEENLSFR